MSSIDKAAIALTMAIVAVALGATASMDATQNASPVITTPTMVPTAEPTMEDGAAEARAEAEAMAAQAAADAEAEAMAAQAAADAEAEAMAAQAAADAEAEAKPETHNVEVPVGTSAPGCEETNSCYSPADITINAGDTIEWDNVDTSIHTATSGSPSEGPSGLFNSELIGMGESYEFTFEEAGSYDYFCLLHPWMSGSITVN
jgi:plastocyanin